MQSLLKEAPSTHLLVLSLLKINMCPLKLIVAIKYIVGKLLSKGTLFFLLASACVALVICIILYDDCFFGEKAQSNNQTELDNNTTVKIINSTLFYGEKALDSDHGNNQTKVDNNVTLTTNNSTLFFYGEKTLDSDQGNNQTDVDSNTTVTTKNNSTLQKSGDNNPYTSTAKNTTTESARYQYMYLGAAIAIQNDTDVKGGKSCGVIIFFTILLSFLSLACLLTSGVHCCRKEIARRENHVSIKFLLENDHVTKFSDGEAPCLVTDMVNNTWKYSQRLGRDSSALNHKSVRVKHVFKVTNEALEGQYKTQKDLGASAPLPELPYELAENPVLTGNVAKIQYVDENSERSALMGADSPEVYLFHGTKLENVANILENGFDLSKAKKGLYGKAIYLAESSEKADQYADWPSKRRQRSLTMFLVKVYLGKVGCHRTSSPVENTASNAGGLPEFDTIVTGFDKRFREYLVYDQKKVLPEFLIIYDRI